MERFERLLAAPEPVPAEDPDAFLNAEQLERFAAALAADPTRWRPLVRHRHDARVYEQIFSDERVNAWLICWSDGHDTGFHDHNDSAGGIAVVAGRVREERLAVGSPTVTRRASLRASAPTCRRPRSTACSTGARSRRSRFTPTRRRSRAWAPTESGRAGRSSARRSRMSRTDRRSASVRRRSPRCRTDSRWIIRCGHCHAEH